VVTEDSHGDKFQVLGDVDKLTCLQLHQVFLFKYSKSYFLKRFLLFLLVRRVINKI